MCLILRKQHNNLQKLKKIAKLTFDVFFFHCVLSYRRLAIMNTSSALQTTARIKQTKMINHRGIWMDSIIKLASVLDICLPVLLGHFPDEQNTVSQRLVVKLSHPLSRHVQVYGTNRRQTSWQSGELGRPHASQCLRPGEQKIGEMHLSNPAK